MRIRRAPVGSFSSISGLERDAKKTEPEQMQNCNV